MSLKQTIRNIKKYSIGNWPPFQLFRFSRPSKLFLLIAFGLATVSSALEGISFGLIIPLLDGLIKRGDFGSIYAVPILSNIISLFAIKKNIHAFLFLLFTVMGTICLYHILRYVSGVITSNVCEKAGHFTRIKIFDRFMGFAKIFFDSNKAGYLHNILLKHTDRAVDLFWNMCNICTHSIVGIVYILIMFFISWKLTLLTLMLLPPIGILMNNITRKIKTTAGNRLDTEQDMSSYIFDILSAIPLIKSQTREKQEKNIFTFSSDILRQERYSIQKKLLLIPHIQEIILAVSSAIMIGIATYLFSKGNIKVLAAFLIYFVILRRLVGEFKHITHMAGEIANTVPSAEKILWILNEKDKPFIKSGKIKFQNLRTMISFENISFSYNQNREILKDVSFSIQKNNIVAIVGPTGVGKTTLASLLVRFYDCTKGRLKIDGIDIQEYDIESLRKKISIVSQEIFIFSDTLKNNITYGLDRKMRENELDRVAKSASLYDFIMSLPDKYDTFVGDRGVKLSGGEKQRVAIARAILKNADILILDEATSSLDTHTERLIQSAIENLIKDKTTVVIAHRLSTIRRANRIIVMENGRIAEEGNFDELIDRKGRFHYYWTLQKFY